MAIGFAICLVVAGGIALAVLRPWEEPAAAAPQAFEYDAANDRYWHAGHGHWHDGPPPGSVPSQPLPVMSPGPWEYNAITDQHWHPSHGHWHDGRPPPPDQRFD